MLDQGFPTCGTRTPRTTFQNSEGSLQVINLIFFDRDFLLQTIRLLVLSLQSICLLAVVLSSFCLIDDIAKSKPMLVFMRNPVYESYNAHILVIMSDTIR